jgi:hypothetical protein
MRTMCFDPQKKHGKTYRGGPGAPRRAKRARGSALGHPGWGRVEMRGVPEPSGSGPDLLPHALVGVVPCPSLPDHTWQHPLLATQTSTAAGNHVMSRLPTFEYLNDAPICALPTYLYA